jgi:hypothetical protein
MYERTVDWIGTAGYPTGLGWRTVVGSPTERPCLAPDALQSEGDLLASGVPHRTRAIALVIVLAAAFFAALGFAPRQAQADVDHVFNVTCPLSHFGSDDPIVSPGQPGNSHRHAFYGNSSTDAFTTTKSLMGSKSTCERGFATADRSAYWVPSLYRLGPDGRVREVRLSADDQHLSAYYRRSGGTTGDRVKPFPRGLRMIAGDAAANKPQDTLDVAWRCNGSHAPESADIPNCSSATVLQAFVSFPDCWDGVNLDSADHRSHMTLSRGDRRSCPRSHPVKLPQLTFELSFNLPPVAGARYELSSGGRYSMHGDFFAAWDDRVQSALVNSCLNGGEYCENPQRSTVDLSAAGPVPRGRQPVSPGPSRSTTTAPAEHSNHAPATVPDASPEPVAAEVVRKPTGPSASLLGGVGAAVIVGSALLYARWRHRRAGRGVCG